MVIWLSVSSVNGCGVLHLPDSEVPFLGNIDDPLTLRIRGITL
jgi:hypothetical protein